ncbi:MAG: hypothetical protein WKI04_03620 [Ferruginibacter sp.]
MNTFSGFPYCEIQFTKEANVFDPQETERLKTVLKEQNITDLFILSHGWNNDMSEARQLYKRLVAKIADEAKGLGGERKYAVAGILWPSKKFAEKELIAGGGSASLLAGAPNAESVMLLGQLENLHNFFDGDTANEILEDAKSTVPLLENDADAQIKFVNRLNDLINQAINKETSGIDGEPAANFSNAIQKDLLVKLSDDHSGEAVNTGGAAGLGGIDHMGSAAGIGDFFGGLFSGARNLLNYVTFFQMKERAGKVGSKGLNPVLKDIRAQIPAVKLHLIGHSFGARVVTAAVAGTDEKDTLSVNTLTLLQAAFSHYGFSEKYETSKNGFFRRVISQGKVSGPILITCTHNDTAVGLAYAIASRIGRQVAEGVGAADDIFGGMGGNGAQKTPEANNDFNLENNTFDFKKGVIYNLNADACISDHSDICKAEVGKAILAAVAVE